MGKLIDTDLIPWETGTAIIPDGSIVEFPYVEKAAIDEMPAAQVKYIIPGRWISCAYGHKPFIHDSSVFKCSECGNTLDFNGVNASRGDANWCPNCGARMEATDDGSH